MDSQCYPITTLPGTTPLFRDYADAASSPHAAALRRWYPANPFSMDWAKASPTLDESHRARLAAALREQASSFGAGAAVLANIERLQQGAAAVVSGQQVGLFGGQLLTLHKAATAIRKAYDQALKSLAAQNNPHGLTGVDARGGITMGRAVVAVVEGGNIKALPDTAVASAK